MQAHQEAVLRHGQVRLDEVGLLGDGKFVRGHRVLGGITGRTAVRDQHLRHVGAVQHHAGSQGEFAGLLAIAAYHRSRGEGHRNVCLIPSSAHGTNPASAVMAGMRVVVVGTDEHGNVDVADLREKIDAYRDNLAALMITYPSTHGVFETAVTDICAMVHDAGNCTFRTRNSTIASIPAIAARPNAVTKGLKPSSANFVIGNESENRNTPSNAKDNPIRRSRLTDHTITMRTNDLIV